MIVSGLTFTKTLSGTGLAVSLLLYTNRLRNSMIVSGLTFRKTLAGTGSAHCSPPMHKWAEKTA